MSDDEQFDNDVEDGSIDSVDTDSDSSSEETTTVTDASMSMLAKDRERQKLQADIEAFLSSGGKIQTVDNNVVGDPPKRPESSYGSQPI